LMLLAEERIILNELIYRYAGVLMPVSIKSRIRKFLNARLQLRDFPDRAVQNLVIQVEALYVYAVLKSVIRSQCDDPTVRRLMTKYGLKTTVPPAVDQDGTIFKKY